MKQINDKLMSWASILDDVTLAQAEQTSTMPFILGHVALMPDAHFGKGSTVGSVIPTLGAIMPSAVGVDIGCGMQAVRTTWTRANVPQDRLLLWRRGIERVVPMGVGKGGANTVAQTTASQRQRIQELVANHPYGDNALADWRAQLGTLGSGNHFIEIAYDEEEYLWITLHSGSRGVGAKTADSYIEIAARLAKQWFIELPHPDLAYLPEGTREFQSYIDELTWLQSYARANRDEMMDRVCNVLDAGWGGFEIAERFDCHHNYAVQENHWGKNPWITRKGAVRARPGDRALIPGSMGSPSFVVTGKGSKVSFDSAPHGAGRVLSRKKAFAAVTLEDARKAMDGVIWNDHPNVLDETPAVYKPIETVIADAADLVKIEHTLRPLMNIKGV